MSTSKNNTRETHANELIDFVIYGDKTLQSLEEEAIADCDYTIKRCHDAIDSIGSTIKFSSPGDVCPECEEVHANLINEVEDKQQDIDTHFATIVDAYNVLEKQNTELRNIVRDLISYAADSIPDDEVKEFEEHLILKKLEGKK